MLRLLATLPVVTNFGRIASTARFAAHQFVATAATQRSVSITDKTPVILFAAVLSTDFNRVSPSGPCAIAA